MAPATILLVFIGAFLLSCSGPEKPKGILSKDQMVSTLTDFHLQEAKLNSVALPTDTAAMMMLYYKDRYAQEQNFSDSALDRSFAYYMNNPQELAEIYDRVVDSLALREQMAEGVAKTAVDSAGQEIKRKSSRKPRVKPTLDPNRPKRGVRTAN